MEVEERRYVVLKTQCSFFFLFLFFYKLKSVDQCICTDIILFCLDFSYLVPSIRAIIEAS